MLILVENKTQNTAGKYNGNRPCFKFPHRNKGGQKQNHALVIHKVFAVAQHQGRRRNQPDHGWAKALKNIFHRLRVAVF